MRIGGPPHLGAHLGLLLHLWGLCGVPPGEALTPSGATLEPSGVPPGAAVTPSGVTLEPSGVTAGVSPAPSGEHLTPPGEPVAPSGVPLVCPGVTPEPSGEPSECSSGLTCPCSGAQVSPWHTQVSSCSAQVNLWHLQVNLWHPQVSSIECPGAPAEGQVRLAGGPHRCAGRVEVFHLGRWGSVCDDTWDLAAAGVTCRQVRCGPALWAPGGAWFGEGAGTCAVPGHTWGPHRCSHAEDAGAACAASAVPAPPQVRLSGAPDRCAGRVEVLRAHLWGTVCDDGWGLRQARALCAHLGCGPALAAPGAARYGRGAGPIWLDDVTCTGEERDFFRCAHRAWGEHNCHHGEDAGVVCAGACGMDRCVQV
ncbi:soluble scavenger receptor cysteine-rich domain-containing protein SSC5D-like, partial [Passerculus sandwichensis]